MVAREFSVFEKVRAVRFAFKIPALLIFLILIVSQAHGHGISDCQRGPAYGGAQWVGLLTGDHYDSLELAKHCVEKHKSPVNEGGGPDNAKALHMAAAFNQYNTVRYLVRKGAYVNIQDNAGWTPLHYAALRGNTEVCKFLVSAGANPNIRSNKGKTAENLAYNRGNRGCAQSILTAR